MTDAEVFIIESLQWKDEKDSICEGRIISEILRLNGKHPEYYYIRTEKELEEVAAIFRESNFRYLHLSCHGNSDGMATTLDFIEFDRLGEILRPNLRKRRLFVSACEIVNDQLAAAIIRGSGCYSVIGPPVKVDFSAAAILWASFYHLMFSRGQHAMKREWLLRNCQQTAKLYGVRLNYYSYSRRSRCGFKLTPILP